MAEGSGGVNVEDAPGKKETEDFLWLGEGFEVAFFVDEVDGGGEVAVVAFVVGGVGRKA